MKREMTFENFFVYEGNKVVVLAAKKIVDFPGELFNPLYVYGGTGIGKTHLLWALYNELKKKEATFFYHAKEFEKYLNEAKTHDSPILVDDIHTIGPQFSDQVLSMIDTLLAANKQVCFSGNAAPRDLKHMDVKLLSRLEGGLVCDIASPKEMALIDMIKKKSGEAGVLLPDEIAVELAQLSTGSIRTIEGMINRLVAYSSLGNVVLDIDTVRMILKEFYPKGIYSPVASLLEELKKNASEVLQDVSEKLDMREEYREKIYIWEMKGFDTSTLKPLLDGDIEDLKKEYDSFIAEVEKLIALQREFGSLDTSAYPDEAMKIESMLFSPGHVDDIEQLMNTLKGKAVVDRSASFDTYLVGECNRPAVNIYREQVLTNFGEKYNPMIVFGGSGTGKTRFLRAVEIDLSDSERNVMFVDLAQNTLPPIDETPYEALIIDNYHRSAAFSEKIRREMVAELSEWVSKGVALFVGSEPFSKETALLEEEKELFERGIEVELHAPDQEIVESYIKMRVDEETFNQLVKFGIPQFNSFPEVDRFIESPREEVVSQVVPLGLVGEEAAVSQPSGEEEARPEPEVIEITEGLTVTEEETEGIRVAEPSEPPVSGVDTHVSAGEGEGEMVALGLPGEEIQEETRHEEEATGQSSHAIEEQAEAVLEAEKAEIEAEPIKGKAGEVEQLKGRILKAVKDERLIVKEIINELVEDNY